MFDHVTIRVADRAASEAFYDTILAPLGVERTYRTSTFSEWRDFMLTATDREHAVTRRLHVVFAAPTEEQVEEFRQAAGDLTDPDGNTVEAVHRDGPRREGIVDHLRIAVADVAATRRFYETIAPSTHLRLDDALTLVAGEPTTNLHIAFPSGDDDEVRAFHAAALAAGYRDHGEPGERPRYHPGYYAAYVLDPDGTNVELVNHHRAG